MVRHCCWTKMTLSSANNPHLMRRERQETFRKSGLTTSEPVLSKNSNAQNTLQLAFLTSAQTYVGIFVELAGLWNVTASYGRVLES